MCKCLVKKNVVVCFIEESGIFFEFFDVCSGLTKGSWFPLGAMFRQNFRIDGQNWNGVRWERGV